MMAQDVATAEASPAAKKDPTRSPGAERMRLHRKRQQEGGRCVTVALSKGGIESLMRFGWLARGDRSNHHAIQRALQSYLADRLA
jgi:hypothetical protein